MLLGCAATGICCATCYVTFKPCASACVSRVLAARTLMCVLLAGGRTGQVTCTDGVKWHACGRVTGAEHCSGPVGNPQVPFGDAAACHSQVRACLACMRRLGGVT
jgi:hypothetical protein